MLKPYQQIPIQECHEPLLPIPGELFILPQPPAYQKLGADYRGKSPYHLRQGVLEALIQAQTYLQQDHPGWRLLIFDAYRPVQVQQFMVDYTYQQILQNKGLSPESLSPSEVEQIWTQVYQIWAIPSLNPDTPPPHSTGAAVDLTLVNQEGEILDLGGEIDELSPRSHPSYYSNPAAPLEKIYHQRRQILYQVMTRAGFRQHLREWWHFSWGDQMWAWLCQQENSQHLSSAFYGRI